MQGIFRNYFCKVRADPTVEGSGLRSAEHGFFPERFGFLLARCRPRTRDLRWVDLYELLARLGFLAYLEALSQGPKVALSV